MAEKESQINPDHEPEKEEEQTPEEIKFSLEFAVGNGTEARLTVTSLDGKSFATAIVSPVALERDILWVTTEAGEGMPVEYSRIKKVELPTGPGEEK